MMDIVGVLGLVVGLISIPIAIILARKGRQKPDIRHAVDFETIVSPEDGVLNSGLSMNFSGRLIQKLSKTTVALWNEHGNTVRGADIVADDPLCVTLASDDIVLQARVIARSRAQNKVKVASDPADISRMLISFDFLDEGDGAVLEILHEGTEQKPRLLGTIRGAALHGASSARLSPGALEAVATRSRITRLRKYVWSPQVGVRLRLLLVVFFTAASFALSGFLLFRFFHEPHLVDVRQYPLNTLDGQRKFSDEVNRLNPVGSSSRIPVVTSAVALISIQVVAITYLFYRLTRAVIPPSIVAIRERHEVADAVVDRDATRGHFLLGSSANLSNATDVSSTSGNDTFRR
jgi:hypothetical protein